MPAWLTWKLFWKVAPPLAILIALGGAAWYIDHRATTRAEDRAKLDKAREDLARADLKNYIDQRVGQVQTQLGEVVTEIDSNLHTQLSNLDVKNTTVIQPTIMKEISSDARFSDPNAGITTGMLQGINEARSQSGGACSRTLNGGISCPVSPATSTGR